ncbi:MAG: hypothetical protein ACK55Z_21500, partial [bacterium]
RRFDPCQGCYNKIMNLEDDIRDILFEIGKDVKIHKLIDGNLIIDIDYEKYVSQIVDKVKLYYPNT